MATARRKMSHRVRSLASAENEDPQIVMGDRHEHSSSRNHRRALVLEQVPGPGRAGLDDRGTDDAMTDPQASGHFPVAPAQDPRLTKDRSGVSHGQSLGRHSSLSGMNGSVRRPKPAFSLPRSAPEWVDLNTPRG